MISALGWGALAASSLVIGAYLGIVRDWSKLVVGVVLAFGAGALISAVSFDLVEEGTRAGSQAAVATGLAIGAMTYFFLDRLVERRSNKGSADDPGTDLALGAFLDGIPEQLVLGIGLVLGGGISASLIAAIFVSNLPEAIGSATSMKELKRPSAFIMKLWIGVAVICTLSTVVGYAIVDIVSGDLLAAIDGFAAGALLVMLIDSMIPEATSKARDLAGLAAVLGFTLAFVLTI